MLEGRVCVVVVHAIPPSPPHLRDARKKRGEERREKENKECLGTTFQLTPHSLRRPPLIRAVAAATASADGGGCGTHHHPLLPFSSPIFRLLLLFGQSLARRRAHRLVSRFLFFHAKSLLSFLRYAHFISHLIATDHETLLFSL